MAANWLAKAPGVELVPVLAAERKRLIAASAQCNVTQCMEGAYNMRILGKSKHTGFVHLWRLVDLPDKEFPCIHALPAAIKEGQALETLYDHKRMSIDYFCEKYGALFRPWPTDVTLEADANVRVPSIQSDPPERGKRGLKPGPNPKHKRKKAKGCN
ncbi:hypothetical protein PHMEG_0005850 [Phytophthora megakarya]|uniref:Uncharacterized protein n=1 Tax=Phytophthora megakarya TaxID=4795 RepID=A0A225WRP7_9STRA|nr:hypothetical protein PHMEG_0005850 [Phytophthora megakarya]